MASLAVASPTPLSGGYRELSHRPSRSTLPKSQITRPNLRRGSPLFNGYGNDRRKDNSLGDSSDDEAPIPKLSAAAEELLGVVTGERPTAGGLLGNINRSNQTNGSPLARDVQGAQKRLPRTQQTQSPLGSNAPSPRVVRITSGRPVSASLRRAISIAGTYDGSPLGVRSKVDVKTPGSRPKCFISGSQTSPSALGHSFGAVPSSASGLVEISHHRTTRNDEAAPAIQGSVRIKRLGKMSGSFLSGPARRGIIRRGSEESQAPYSAAEHHVQEGEVHDWGSKSTKQSPCDLQPVSPVNMEEKHHQNIYFDNINASHQQSPSPLPVSKGQPMVNAKKNEEHVHDPLRPTLASSLNKPNPPSFKPIRVPALSPRLDQENVPPPTFKRDKHVHEIISIQDRPRLADIVHKVQHPMSPARKPLANKSNNTPLRPAPPPPPPKMSILETATAPAVSSATNAKQRRPRNMISVNGKHFTRMECVGRGGSGRVYRVMADNFKLFAVKSVSLEGLDELTIRGFKGEIELLKRLQDVERVVRLYDYEINEEKKVLRVLMDIGELDLKKVLDPRLDEESGKFDITFTRYIWKEMLECVSAVHAHDIVHSDLKPANFVMMQGRLKLIDFGIANAIQDDTVNVHREQQVGTPNYMSPETLVDTNNNPNNQNNQNNIQKLIKVGKPSDIWSLGCILYQITYGKPPFHHITNNIRKVVAITSPSHPIPFPPLGLGNVPLPTSLLRSLRKCLDRDPARRPTVDQLLEDSEGRSGSGGGSDVFLHPDTTDTVPVSVDLIGRLQHNIIQHVVAHGVPGEEELKVWPRRFFESIRAAVEEGRA